jgi:hypothetical protein
MDRGLAGVDPPGDGFIAVTAAFLEPGEKLAQLILLPHRSLPERDTPFRMDVSILLNPSTVFGDAATPPDGR